MDLQWIEFQCPCCGGVGKVDNPEDEDDYNEYECDLCDGSGKKFIDLLEMQDRINRLEILVDSLIDKEEVLGKMGIRR